MLPEGDRFKDVIYKLYIYFQQQIKIQMNTGDKQDNLYKKCFKVDCDGYLGTYKLPF